jgi:hypothetical protein
LEVLKDEYLQDPDHLTIDLGDEDLAAASARLGHGGPVGVNVILVLVVGIVRAALDDQ